MATITQLTTVVVAITGFLGVITPLSQIFLLLFPGVWERWVTTTVHVFTYL